MKKQQMVKGLRSRKHMVVGRPTSVSSISFDDFYEDVSDHWLEKSRRLQARRWRRIRHQTV